jgi:chemotaxis protein CheD
MGHVQGHVVNREAACRQGDVSVSGRSLEPQIACRPDIAVIAADLGLGKAPRDSGAGSSVAVDRYLPPGQLLASWEPARITTILGSCVAVCLWDPELGLGGMNHFLLPRGSATTPSAACRFGNLAVPRLIDGVLAVGCRREGLRAKVFGGACVLEAFRGGARHLGTQNVEAALEVLKREAIPVVAEDIGGDRGRKLVFSTSDGGAWVRSL